MGAFSKLISELTPDAIRWAQSVARKINEPVTEPIDEAVRRGDRGGILKAGSDAMTRLSVENQLSQNRMTPAEYEAALREIMKRIDPDYKPVPPFRATDAQTADVIQQSGQKLVNLSQNYPQFFDMYQDMPFYSALKEAEAGTSDLAIMSPTTFRRTAAQLRTDDPFLRDMVDEKVAALKEAMQAGDQIDAIPLLEYENPVEGVAQVVMHDGRHRNRALEGLGESESIVRMIPKQTGPRLKEMDPSTGIYTEQSMLQVPGEGGKKLGTLDELIKFLMVPVATTTGALSALPLGENGDKVVE